MYKRQSSTSNVAGIILISAVMISAFVIAKLPILSTQSFNDTGSGYHLLLTRSTQSSEQKKKPEKVAKAKQTNSKQPTPRSKEIHASFIPATPKKSEHKKGEMVDDISLARLPLPVDTDIQRYTVEDDQTILHIKENRKAILTIQPTLQKHLLQEIKKYKVPVSALVAMKPASGEILAYLSYSSDQKKRDLVQNASFPAASLFKVITGAALLGKKVSPQKKVCYTGGSRGLQKHNVIDRKHEDACTTFSLAMGHSTNAVFGKLALRYLHLKDIQRYAQAFAFGEQPPFDLPIERSKVDVADVDTPLELARLSAGLDHSFISPLHAALIMSTIANRGTMPRASVVKKVLEHGKPIYRHRSSDFRRVIPSSIADKLNKMMRTTVTRGTAKKCFHDLSGKKFLPGMNIAVKTGSLSYVKPYRGYSWAAGFAPADNPAIAVAALVVNRLDWKIKGCYLLKEALHYYLFNI